MVYLLLPPSRRRCISFRYEWGLEMVKKLWRRLQERKVTMRGRRKGCIGEAWDTDIGGQRRGRGIP